MGLIVFCQWPSGGQVGLTMTTVMSNSVRPSISYHQGVPTPMLLSPSAIEIDDGQLQSTTEGNALSPGENFMTGFIW